MRTPPTLKTRPHTTPPASTARRRAQTRHAAADLTPRAIEQIAQRVAQLLHERGETDPQSTPPRLLDASQLARHLGVTRTWVYEHAHHLGAIRLGTGTKARLRFDLHTATTAINSPREHQPRDTTPAVETPRRGRPRRRPQPTVPLLPIHEPRSRGILARLTHIRKER